MARRPLRETGAIDMPTQRAALADAFERLAESTFAAGEVLCPSGFSSGGDRITP